MNKKTNKIIQDKSFNPSKLKNIRGYDGVDYDYDRQYGTREYGRDSVIINERITEVNINRLNNFLFEYTTDSKNELLKYCVHRILSHSQARDISAWSLNKSQGYYGEEIDGAILDYGIFDKLVADLYELKNLESDLEKVLFVLKYEYSYLLECLKDVNSCNIVSIGIEDVYVPQQDHYRRVDKEIVDKYNGYNLPVCVCLLRDGKYKLIDGYHRLFASKNAGKTEIQVVVLE